MPEWLSRKEKCTVDTVQSFTQVVKTPRAKLNALAWGMILFVSVPQIILHLLGQDVPGGPLGLSWLEWAQMVVLAAADTYKLLGRVELGETSNATPAVADGVMYIRTLTHLMALPSK